MFYILKNGFGLEQNSINIFRKSTTSWNCKKNFREILTFHYRGSTIQTKQQQSEQSKHHNKKQMTKNKTKCNKNQIKDLLSTYHILSTSLKQVRIIQK